MNQKIRYLLIGGAGLVSLAVAAVAGLYLTGKTPPGGGVLDRITSGIQSVTGAVPAATTPGEFVFRRLEIDTSKPQAEACLVFTRRLDASGRTHYEDYVAIDPVTKVVARVVDDRLCLAGLAFDKTYNVTLKTGLPDAANAKLAGEETVPVELRDKPALVRFNGGIILPRENAAGVPVTTINIDKLNLKVIRVGDRLLSQLQNDTVDQTTVWGWDAKQLQDAQGALIWQGTMTVQNVKNDTVVTNVPIRDILKDRKPGAYVLIASDAAKPPATDTDYGQQMAAQWVIDSNIALTTFQSANPATGKGAGLAVFARAFSDARPLSGVRLSLVARNNNVLATATTGSDGRADFEPGLFRASGGEEPVVVMAYGSGEDFNFLDLRRSAFDLTDRGVGGRAAPGPIDAFLYTERGVYRPGETVQLAAMLRDRIGASVSAPLTLVAQRPDGVEAGRMTLAGDRLQAGSATWALALSASAPHGRWQISAYVDPKAAAIGRVQFDVADFVPQRLNVTLTALTPAVAPGGDVTLRAETRFLYGPPASGLSGDGEARILADARPFAAWTGWQFGRIDDSFSETRLDLAVPATDAQGIARITANTGALADTTLPLKITARISVHEPGGRITDKTLDIPVRGTRPLIGIRPDFQGGSVAEGTRAAFQIVAVDGAGRRIALPGVTVSWVREDTSYQWFQREGEWRFQGVTRDRLVTSGSQSIAANAPARVGQSLPYGTYRLTVTDTSGAASSFRFYSGWAASSEGDRPDRIPVAADKPAYAPGSVARIRIKPDADGKALVVVAGDRIFSSKVIDAPASGATVDIPVSANWGAGAYVLVTHYRPLARVTGRTPVRAIGLTWLGVDNAPRTLTVALGTPDRVRPRGRVAVPVRVTGLRSGEDAFVTVAAVDEGILQLTDFKSPKPVDHYFGKRRLGVNMRDDYGRLIRPERAPLGALTQGGDALGGRGLAVVPIRSVALFSGIVRLAADGTATVTLDVPDFNGSLRLMAVAWSSDKLGNADKMMIVRDPVVADLVLPRFLAPGDTAQVALNLDNVEGAAGNYFARIRTRGPLSTSTTIVTRTLTRGQRVLAPVALTGAGLGVAGVTLDVTGPGGFRVTRDWPIEVRSPQLDIAREEEVPLAANATYNATRALIGDLVPSTASVTLTVSATHGYANVAGLLKWLDKYPYGCIEQTTSRAMPLLDFNELADLAGLPRDAALRGRLQNVIDLMLDMQNTGGDFGMWGPGEEADPFLSVYALDFLYAAKRKNYVVPDDALRRGGEWLRRLAAEDGQVLARAYAFYVLAKAGQANLSDLRYFSDTKMAAMTSGLAPALSGAAAALMGDRSRAEAGFARARAILVAANPVTYPHDTYGSLLRDLSGALALAAENGKPDLVPVLLEKGRTLNQRVDDTTTQEKGWMLKAAYALTRQRLPLNVTVNGAPAQPREGAVRLTPGPQQLANGIALANRGDAVVWRTASVSGTPAAALPPAASGMTLNKTVWTMSGAPADLSRLRQNDRVIIEISGALPNNLYRQLGVIDLLPAGLEIEQALSGEEDAKLYPFLGKLSDTSMTGKRDDRFVAAFSLGTQYRPANGRGPEPQPQFRVAYIARAVTVGRFALPAAHAGDMYAPAITARTSVGTVSIAQ